MYRVKAELLVAIIQAARDPWDRSASMHWSIASTNETRGLQLKNSTVSNFIKEMYGSTYSDLWIVYKYFISYNTEPMEQKETNFANVVVKDFPFNRPSNFQFMVGSIKHFNRTVCAGI